MYLKYTLQKQRGIKNSYKRERRGNSGCDVTGMVNKEMKKWIRKRRRDWERQIWLYDKLVQPIIGYEAEI